MSVKGSCLCGGVRYEVDGGLGRVVNCHCSMCRKATGAAFRTRASVKPAAFHWLGGEELVSRYQSSPGETRTFCRVCGATLATSSATKRSDFPWAPLTMTRGSGHLPMCLSIPRPPGSSPTGFLGSPRESWLEEVRDDAFQTGICAGHRLFSLLSPLRGWAATPERPGVGGIETIGELPGWWRAGSNPAGYLVGIDRAVSIVVGRAPV